MPTCSEWFARYAQDGRPPALIIAEVAQAHDGSLGMAHAFVDAVARAGADAVKFQTHLAHAESTAHEPWRVRFAPQDASRRDYWKRMEFSPGQWRELKRHADERGLLFLSSPFSNEAVDLLAALDVEAWKVASGEISNLPMLERMLDTGRPLLLSTGMSSFVEVDRAVNLARGRNVPFGVLQCTSTYPCRAEDVGLNVMTTFRRRYDCPVGLSDHSGTIFPGLAAAVLGAAILELHVTLSREMFGPDVAASITTGELRQLVEGVRFVEAMLGHAVDKDEMAVRVQPLRQLFTKSVVPRIAIRSGTILTREHLTVKKPGTGIPAARLDDLIGLRARRDLTIDELVREEDVERP